ncbi:MAG TPA: AAA family ATPase [Archangium sp.]|uniref:AAA family ATPase n=1 Tax=Archangium sp. TaxID=1872627 RepID=UPI002E30F733|nr:AAA family ATPase [Archangium sp.]HEX5750856.1 AAA family ATPase [Archangium sp.]
MKVRRLDMTSFRGFRELTLEFNGPMTVLVGTNGAGKTSILDCLAVLLSQVSSGILSGTGHGRRFYESDIQYGQPHTLNSVEAAFGEKLVKWSLALVRKGMPRIVSSNLSGLKELITLVQEENARGQYQLPLAIYYPVNRAPDVPSRIREQHEFGPLSAFDQALEGGGRNFRLFFEWFREREDLENQQSRRLQDYGYRDGQLEAVRGAIAGLVPGMWGIQVERAPQRMVILKDDAPNARLEVNQLSDGEKTLLAMAGDLGRRLAMANPSLENPLQGEAVVMIDEIELHLHPGWQRMVVKRLQETFPNCQFILTTHSPQVLSQVPAEAVILLDRFQRAEPSTGTLGRDSNSILTEVMGVPERPEATAERIQEIARMIDREELPEARRALDELARQLGEHDSEVVRLRALIGFLDA